MVIKELLRSSGIHSRFAGGAKHNQPFCAT
jgi:hypothetical protein